MALKVGDRNRMVVKITGMEEINKIRGSDNGSEFLLASKSLVRHLKNV